MVVSLYKKLELSHPSELGRAMALVNAVFQSTISLASKKIQGRFEVKSGMDGASIVFVRCILNISLGYAIILHFGIKIWPESDHDRNTQIIRMVFGGIGLLCFHQSLTMIPLQIVTVLVSCNTPFNAIFKSILGDVASVKVWICMIFTFLGIVLVVDPSLVGIGTSSYSKSNLHFKRRSLSVRHHPCDYSSGVFYLQ